MSKTNEIQNIIPPKSPPKRYYSLHESDTYKHYRLKTKNTINKLIDLRWYQCNKQIINISAGVTGFNKPANIIEKIIGIVTC